MIRVMTMLRLALGALLLAGLTACGTSTTTSMAERRADAAGWRLEHFPQERLLFVHRPNGDKDGVELATLRRVFLHRVPAGESTTGKASYWWNFEGPDHRTIFAPFFSTEPGTVVGVLARELPGFDMARASKMTTAFQEDRGSYCLVWASEAYPKETPATTDTACRP